MPHLTTSAAIGFCVAIQSIASASNASAQARPVIVNVENFVRAETAAQFDRIVEMAGGINRFFHLRGPTPSGQADCHPHESGHALQWGLVDISKRATLIVPDAEDRYMSIMVVNENHYINKVIHEPGEHELTVAELGTPYVCLAARILVDAPILLMSGRRMHCRIN